MILLVDIKDCNDCRHLSHTGAFTRGGAKLCCDHDDAVSSRGDDCFKRVIPATAHPPKWCPLLSGGKY